MEADSLMPVRRLALILLAAVALAATLAGPAAALGPGQLRHALARRMAPAGSGSGALVVDLDTGRHLYSRYSHRRRMPASVEKLWTTSTALAQLGPDARLHTDVLATAPIDLDGTLDGDLYLRGGGDPTLTSADLAELAQDLVAATTLHRVTGHVYGDESLFDTLRGVPSAGYAISVDVDPLGALMVDRGHTGISSPYYQSDPASWAATRFAKDLRADGVRISRTGRAGTTPVGATELDTFPSAPLSTLLAWMNKPSDNYLAETLLKDLGAAADPPGSTADGAAVVRQTEASVYRLHPSVVDGSGLSRADGSSPAQVVNLLRRIRSRPESRAFWRSLAVAGRSGTLKDRMRHTRAHGNCRGKTGTLHDVSNIVGYCEASGGHTLAFAILMNYVNPYAAHRLQDRMVTAISHYRG
jgi:serine-type D-Ala-D-Ala carboxypeptidase/endopeptidase (penicillin-binding protein 4)